ncbi:MAG: ABC transporter permease [Bacilli bacterium]
MKATLSQWKAELLRTGRDRRFFLLTLGMPVAFYLIFINQQGGNAQIAGTFWGEYFMVSMAAFGVLGSSINTFGVRLAAERKGGWVRLLRTTPLSSFGYALAKTLTQLTLSLLIVIVVFAVAHFSQHVDLSPARWLQIMAWLWLGSLPFAALGVLIGMAGNAAQALGTLVYLALSMLGGLWTPVQALPKTMREIARWMPTYHFARPAWNLLSGHSVQWSDVAILLAYFVLFISLAAIVQRRVDSRPEG